MTSVEFRGDLWRQKTRVAPLSYGIVLCDCVILFLAVLIQYRLVTDKQTEGQTDTRRQWRSQGGGGTPPKFGSQENSRLRR